MLKELKLAIDKSLKIEDKFDFEELEFLKKVHEDLIVIFTDITFAFEEIPDG
jgi:hypothetical protein